MLGGMNLPPFDQQRACLAANLRKLRLRMGISQERLALEADIDRTFISQIERGIGNPSLRILCQIAEQLETDVCTLLKPPRKTR